MGPMPCAFKCMKFNIAGWFRIRTDTTRSEKAARWGCLVDVSGPTVNGCGQPGPGQGRTGAAPSHDHPPNHRSRPDLFLLKAIKAPILYAPVFIFPLGSKRGADPNVFVPPEP